jgi:hypothetical protein
VNTTLSRRLAAYRLGITGGILGALAGVTQAAAGSHIPQWTGNKASPLGLGLLTVGLSLAALAAASTLRPTAALPPRRRVFAALVLLAVGALCFSTVGRLWYIPGIFMLAAFGITLAAGGTRELRPVVRTNWTRGLISLLGAFEVLMAISAAPLVTIVTGIVGGGALLAAPWLVERGRVAGTTLLLLGTLPFAALTWWTLVSPLLALLALALGLPMMRRTPTAETWGSPAAALGAGSASS